MQGVRRCTTGALTIDVGETAEKRVERVIRENPVVIFSTSSSCCMCHVMKRLLSTLGAHPTVIQLDDSDEIQALFSSSSSSSSAADGGAGGGRGGVASAPAVFIGGRKVGGLESLMALHLSGELITLLRQVDALSP